MRFSIVIPTYRRRSLVLRAICALAEQEFTDFEVVVVVDGSDDGTAAALRSLRLPFLLHVVDQCNRGAAHARNRGAAEATGEILLFLDDDMLADKRMLLEHERSHREGADVVLGDIPLHPESPDNLLSRGVRGWAARRAARLSEASEIAATELLTGHLSLARALFVALGRFDPEITRGGRFGGEDVEFGQRVLQSRCRVTFNPAAVAFQYYDVDPATFLRRAYQAARAHQELAFRYPAQAAELTGPLRFHSRRSRWLFAGLIAAPAPLRWPLSTGVSALIRAGRDTSRLRRAFLLTRTMEHTRGLRDARRALGTGAVVVLAYHAIADLRHDPILRPYGVPPELLEAQLDALRRARWRFVDLDAVLDAFAGRRRLPRRAVLVTFDDCYEDLRTVALPILSARQIKAVGFAAAGLLGGFNQWDVALGAAPMRLLSADELRELEQNGLEIGSHGECHRPFTSLSAEQLEDELTASCATLEQVGLRRPRALAYPYGEWSPEVAAATRAAGYELAFTVEPGAVARHSDRWGLPRIEVLGDDSPSRLWLKVTTASWPPPLRDRLLRRLDSRR